MNCCNIESLHVSHEYYYDYQHYLKNTTFESSNQSRRFFYINLGCFDGRDLDYFIHFHSEEAAEKVSVDHAL